MRGGNTSNFGWPQNEKRTLQSHAKGCLEGEIHLHFGEMVENGQPQFSIRKWSLPRRQTPNLFTSNSQEHWYANG